MSLRQRIATYLYSRRNIVGCALAVVGLGIYFTGVVSGLLGFAVIAALYAIGALLTPSDVKVSVQFDQTQDAGMVRTQLGTLQRQIQGRVAPDIAVRVAQISQSILATLPEAGTDAGDPNVYLIQQTALTYLPQALNSYLAVPQAIAEHRPIAGGRTPHDVLLEQLNLMSAKLQEVADDLARHDSDRLLANGQFLAERFGSSSLDIGADVPIPTVTPPDATATATQVASPTTSAAPTAAQQPSPAEEQERVH